MPYVVHMYLPVEGPVVFFCYYHVGKKRRRTSSMTEPSGSGMLVNIILDVPLQAVVALLLKNTS